MDLMNLLRKNCKKSTIHYLACRIIYETWLWKNYKRFTPEQVTKRKYKKRFGYDIDLQHPQTLNEKIQWLKLYLYKEYYPICADKYAMKTWVSSLIGDQYNVPILFHTDNWKDITEQNITIFPCIIKANHSSHDYLIFRKKEEVNWKELKLTCRFWLHRDYATESQELQYRDIHRQIIVEPLLTTSDGKIPNDYKLNYINGKLQFIYISWDREGKNHRYIYDLSWNKLNFNWDSSSNKEYKPANGEIQKPNSLEKMKEVGSAIAKFFPYVRVDFYDVDGKPFLGEITLHHGGGFDAFRPREYDQYYGNLLQL